MRNKISVCIATYYGEKYILEQLNYIQSQLDQNDEIIISNDPSTDNIINLIKSLNDSRIKIHIHENMINLYKVTYANILAVYKNFENALKHTTGDYVFLSIQDDIGLPTKVTKLKDGDDCVLHNNIVINNDYKTRNQLYFTLIYRIRMLYAHLIAEIMATITNKIYDLRDFAHNTKTCQIQ